MSKPTGSCIRCHSRGNLCNHHIVYNDETVALCFRCHKEITLLNTMFSRFLGKKLSDNERLKIWNIWANLGNDEWVKNSILRYSCVGGQATDEAE